MPVPLLTSYAWGIEFPPSLDLEKNASFPDSLPADFSLFHSMVLHTFSKKERILKRADFVNLNRSGERHHSRHFIVILKKNGLNLARLGITVSKKTGNAVKRNRTKRLIREFFRLNKSLFPQGYDIIVIAKKDASYLDLRRAGKELAEILLVEKLHA